MFDASAVDRKFHSRRRFDFPTLFVMDVSDIATVIDVDNDNIELAAVDPTLEVRQKIVVVVLVTAAAMLEVLVEFGSELHGAILT